MSDHHMKSVMAANEFRIWRAAQSVNWDCTMHDLADETGLSYRTVWDTCRRKGWTGKLISGREGYAGRMPVDVAMRGLVRVD